MSLEDKVARFFDDILCRFYKKEMLKYLNMALFREGFIVNVLKTIEDAKEIEDPDERHDYIDDSSHFSIPFDFLLPKLEEDNEISKNIALAIEKFISEQL